MIRFYILPDFYPGYQKSMVMEIMGTYRCSRSKRAAAIGLKPSAEAGVRHSFSSLVLMLVYPWLYTVIGVLIKLSSPGPVLFKQKRTGLYGKFLTAISSVRCG